MKIGLQATIRHFDDDERGGYALLIAQALIATAAGFWPGGTVLPRSFGV